MKVGDLVQFQNRYHLAIKSWQHIWSFQEIGSHFPPTIMDKEMVERYLRTGAMRIISKSLNKS